MTDTASAAPSDADILALNAGEIYFSESPSKYPEAGHGTQYHAGTPGVLGFARAVLAKLGQPTPPAADQEPFGYFRAEPFGWTDCAETDEGAVALYEHPTPPAVVEPPELSPDFTDTARAALLWVLWHHQGGSSPVGQPIRFALGMGQHDRLNEHQLAEAKRWERLHPVNPAVFPRGAVPLTDEQIEKLRRETFSTENPFCPCDSKTMRKAVWAAERAHGIGIKKENGNG